MNLGERIYEYRKANHLSQGELADQLDVSRQSISKWENNLSTPDLDRLVKLADIFGISLDELIREGTPVTPTPQKESPLSMRKIVGLLLLMLGIQFTIPAFIYGFGFNYYLLFVLPFLLSAGTCFLFKTHLFIKCAWLVFFCFDITTRFSTGTHWGIIVQTFRAESVLNPYSLLLGWVKFISIIVMIEITAFIFRKAPISNNQKHNRSTICFFAVFLAIQLLLSLFPYKLISTEIIIAFNKAFFIAYSLLDWIKTAAFTAFWVNTARLIHSKDLKSTKRSPVI